VPGHADVLEIELPLSFSSEPFSDSSWSTAKRSSTMRSIALLIVIACRIDLHRLGRPAPGRVVGADVLEVDDDVAVGRPLPAEVLVRLARPAQPWENTITGNGPRAFGRKVNLHRNRAIALGVLPVEPNEIVASGCDPPHRAGATAGDFATPAARNLPASSNRGIDIAARRPRYVS
jgi:hypothetical protein